MRRSAPCAPACTRTAGCTLPAANRWAARPAPEAAWDAAHFRQQREKNRAYYQEHLVENKLAIAQLTQKLQNTLLLRAEDEGGTAAPGGCGRSWAWRAGALGDERVFSRRSPQEPGELSVDLLLDGSASQNRQQEKLATQAYLIAESLSRCRHPRAGDGVLLRQRLHGAAGAAGL